MSSTDQASTDVQDLDDEPALFQHCCTVYEAMAEQAETQYNEPSDSVVTTWTGMLTHLFDDIGLGISRYTRITRVMREAGWIEQLRRGAGNVPGEWALYMEPDLERFHHAKQQLAYKEQREERDPIEQRVRDLVTQFRDFDNRLSLLEDIVFASRTGLEPQGATLEEEERYHISDAEWEQYTEEQGDSEDAYDQRTEPGA